jgi:glutamyl/glutaminyl-tRNA synthetase
LAEAKYIDKENFDRAYVLSLVKLFQARLPRLNDFVDWADFFFLKEVKMDPEAQKKHLLKDHSKEFKMFADRLEALQEFSVENIEKSFRDMVAEMNIEAKVLIHPVRVALTGKTVGPGLFEVIYYLGKERSRERLLRYAN